MFKSVAFGLLLGATALTGLSTSASATPYAFADIQVSNFALAINNGGNFSVNANNSSSANTSVYGLMSSALPTDTENAPTAANQVEATSGPGPFPGQDVYAANAGRTGGMNGSRADSMALSGNGSAVAESQLLSGQNGRASGTGTTSVNITLTAAGTVSFSFTASADAEASTTLANETASATNALSYTIADINGTVVFTYSPDALNYTVSSSSGLPPADTTLNRASAPYSTTTGQLAAGTYTISAREASTVNVSAPAATTVPEPTSLALLGAGLGLVGFYRRRRQG